MNKAVENFIWMTDIASALRMSSTSTCRQWVLKQGFQFQKRRNPKTSLNGLCLPQSQLDQLFDIRQQAGFFGNEMEFPAVIGGVFYLILPVPEFTDKRVKLGFTTDIESRVMPYRTICPNTRVVKTWACLEEWEKVAIASATRIECTQVGVEVFNCEDLGRLIERINQFFSIMPSLEDEV